VAVGAAVTLESFEPLTVGDLAPDEDWDLFESAFWAHVAEQETA
jgi:hypothetical protein